MGGKISKGIFVFKKGLAICCEILQLKKRENDTDGKQSVFKVCYLSSNSVKKNYDID